MAEWSSFPTRLRDLLDPVGKRLGLEDAVDSGRLFERWAEIVGNDIASHVEPTSLRDGVLRVRTDSPTWATEVSYMATEIAGRLNRALGKALVKELKVSSGPRSSDRGPRKDRPARPIAAPAEQPESDPRRAFDKAHRAWQEQHRKRGPDQDF